MIRVVIHNHKCQITGDRLLVEEMRSDKAFKIRVKNAYFAMMRSSGWDGYRRFITETGMFSTGLLPEVVAWLNENEVEFETVDKRSLFKEKGIITNLGDFEERSYQAEAVKALLNNRLQIGEDRIRFQRGILWEATNAGKNLIASYIYSSFLEKRTGLFLINNQVIFNQAVEELKAILGKDVVGQVGSKKMEWKRINVCMVQTLANRIKSNAAIRERVAKTDIIIVDESDEVITRKDTQYIFSTAWNCPIRIGLTGTQGLSKDKIKNKQSIEYLGPVLHVTRNKDLVKAGHSAKPKISIYEGNTKVRCDGDWQGELELGIIQSKERNKKVWKRVKHHVNKGRPTVVVFQYHRHVKALMKAMPSWFKEEGIKVDHVHSKTKNRDAILHRFKEGKIDVLLASMIIRRGKNLPSIKALINAAGGDSHSNLLQLLGRALRKKTKGKNIVYVEDFKDLGRYLQRHSKHRIAYYKKEGFPVNEKYKKNK